MSWDSHLWKTNESEAARERKEAADRIEAQAKQIAELEAKNKRLFGKSVDALFFVRAKNEAQDKRIAELEAALAFYADESAWDEYEDDKRAAEDRQFGSALGSDKGEIARAALILEPQKAQHPR